MAIIIIIIKIMIIKEMDIVIINIWKVLMFLLLIRLLKDLMLSYVLRPQFDKDLLNEIGFGLVESQI